MSRQKTGTISARTQHPASSGVRGGPPFGAMTSDLWYTLLYHHPVDQRRLEKGRSKVWTDPLVHSGMSRSTARSAVDRMDRWARDREAAGHAPSVKAQAGWLARECHARLPSDEISEALDRLISEARVLLAPGASAALDRMQGGGVRLGLVSNLMHGTADGARELLDSFGILGRFSVLVFSDEHPWSKPGPEPFRYAAARLRTAPSNAAHVGDLAYDVLGADRAGFHAILYTGLHRLEPEYLRKLAYAVDPAVDRQSTWARVARRALDGPTRA